MTSQASARSRCVVGGSFSPVLKAKCFERKPSAVSLTAQSAGSAESGLPQPAPACAGFLADVGRRHRIQNEAGEPCGDVALILIGELRERKARGAAIGCLQQDIRAIDAPQLRLELHGCAAFTRPFACEDRGGDQEKPNQAHACCIAKTRTKWQEESRRKVNSRAG